jgi:hypothetical protein
MEIMARRRFSMPAVLGLALVLGLPALVEAQLFPNATIKRQRASCLNEDPVNEDPVYRMYRQHYYGYFPTCWRKFPDGWGCPSKESSAAEVAKAMEDIKNQQKKISETAQEGDENQPTDRPDEGDNPAMPDDSRVPALPPAGESPFDRPLDRGAPALPRPLDDGGNAPPAAPAPAADDPRAPRAEARRLAPARQPGGVTSAPSAIEDLVPPSDVPSIESTPADGEARTTPSLPSAAVPPLGASPDTPVTIPTPNSNLTPTSAVNPAQAPPSRRSLIGGLIDNLRGRRRR